MSERAMSDFLAAAVKDAALSGRIREAVAGNERIVAVQTIADLAASAGYEVGPADVEGFRLRALAEIEGELSDASLDAVAGGTVVSTEPVPGPFTPANGGMSAIGALGGFSGSIDDWLKGW